MGGGDGRDDAAVPEDEPWTGARPLARGRLPNRGTTPIAGRRRLNPFSHSIGTRPFPLSLIAAPFASAFGRPGPGHRCPRIRGRSSGTPLGAAESWPPALRAVLGTALGCRFPAFLAWGPDLICFHNDACAPLLGPESEVLGRPLREAWPEAWRTLGPIVRRALAGEASRHEDLPLAPGPGGAPRGDLVDPLLLARPRQAGGVGGVLC